MVVALFFEKESSLADVSYYTTWVHGGEAATASMFLYSMHFITRRHGSLRSSAPSHPHFYTSHRELCSTFSSSCVLLSSCERQKQERTHTRRNRHVASDESSCARMIVSCVWEKLKSHRC
jgi:hypothetical protein